MSFPRVVLYQAIFQLTKLCINMLELWKVKRSQRHLLAAIENNWFGVPIKDKNLLFSIQFLCRENYFNNFPKKVNVEVFKRKFFGVPLISCPQYSSSTSASLIWLIGTPVWVSSCCNTESACLQIYDKKYKKLIMHCLVYHSCFK